MPLFSCFYFCGRFHRARALSSLSLALSSSGSAIITTSALVETDTHKHRRRARGKLEQTHNRSGARFRRAARVMSGVRVAWRATATVDERTSRSFGCQRRAHAMSCDVCLCVNAAHEKSIAPKEVRASMGEFLSVACCVSRDLIGL